MVRGITFYLKSQQVLEASETLLPHHPQMRYDDPQDHEEAVNGHRPVKYQFLYRNIDSISVQYRDSPPVCRVLALDTGLAEATTACRCSACTQSSTRGRARARTSSVATPQLHATCTGLDA